MNSIVFKREAVYIINAFMCSQGKGFHSLLLKLKDVHINRTRVNNGACFVASQDNSMALQHVTIHCV